MQYLLYTVLIITVECFMNTIDQAETGCYLLNENAFRLRTKHSFDKKVLQGRALKIEGVYTYPDTSFTLDYKKKKIYNTRYNGTDFYDLKNITVLINDVLLKGQFVDMYNNRMRYYTNVNEIQTMLIASLVVLEDHSILTELDKENARLPYTNNGNTLYAYTMITNIILPNMDIVAPKLVSY